MVKLLVIAKNNFLAQIAYRFHFIFLVLTNLLYIFITYYLWKAIYAGSTGTLAGMTFDQTFLYLSLASSLFILFQTYLEWITSRRIITGDLIMDLLKPLDFQAQRYAFSFGYFLTSLVTVTIPVFLLLIFVFKAHFVVSANLIFFPVSVLVSFFLSCTIDFFIGCMAFYTESIWGIYAVKESVVLFLSGALIPISFFPAQFRNVLGLLPFQAIYNVPLSIITSKSLTFIDCLEALTKQLLWLACLLLASRLFYRKSRNVLTVNGG